MQEDSNGDAQQQAELGSVLRHLAFTVHRMVPEVADLDPLPNTEVAVIKQVLGSPGITVGDLSRLLSMRQSNVSAAVRELVDRGLVSRESSPADRRLTLLVPTEKSLGARASIDEVWSGTIRAAMARLDPDQVAALEAASPALRALHAALRAERGE